MNNRAMKDQGTRRIWASIWEAHGQVIPPVPIIGQGDKIHDQAAGLARLQDIHDGIAVASGADTGRELGRVFYNHLYQHNGSIAHETSRR